MIPELTPSKKECCGCKACANACSRNAISFLPDEYGFEYPHIDADKCVECGKCLKACDFKKSEQEGVTMHTPLEGYAARHIDREVYANSTSGGVFSALAQWILDRDGVVYGCTFTDDWRPMHIEADCMEKVIPMRGSKYVQSDTGFGYQKVKSRLQEGKWVLFTGTPCQVAGLYAYLGKADTQKLLTMDIVCHGVPSPLVFRNYIHYLEDKFHKKIKIFQFRNKIKGWAKPSIGVGFEDGSFKTWSVIRDLYYEAFHFAYLQRPSCFECKYATGKRVGDLTLGDFWGWQKAHITMSTQEGVSCCLLNTGKAKEVFAQLNINTNKVTVDSIIQGNYHLRNRSKKKDNWETVMDTIVQNGFAVYAARFRTTHWITMAKRSRFYRIWQRVVNLICPNRK
jgi:coenzyme F420-reducing hydrogenase beta subunit